MTKATSTALLTAFTLAMYAPSVNAEWDAATKAEARRQLDGAIAAEVASIWVLKHGLEYPSEMAQVISVARNTMFGWEDYVQALVALFDMGDVESGAFLSETRADTLARVTLELSSAVTRFTNAQATLATMSNSTVMPTVSYQLGNLALNTANSLNLALDYTEPRVAMQLALPETVRFSSPAFGPHGWYEMVGRTVLDWAIDHGRVWRYTLDALDMDSSLLEFTNANGDSAGLIFVANSLGRVAKHMLNSMGLFAGVENTTDAAAIDTIFSGFSTTRPRHFARGILIHEKLDAVVHQGRPASIDVNGRVMQRGLGYDLLVNGLAFTQIVKDTTPTTVAKVPLLFAAGFSQEEWLHADGLAQETITFKWANPGPPNPPIGGECPECPPPTVCPTVTPTVALTPEGVPIFQCVEN